MAEDKKHLFKKGQSGNPSGRAKMPKELREAKTLNQIEVAKLLNRFMKMSFEELKVIAENTKSQSLELMISKIIVEAIKKGDHSRLNFIFDRMVGKVPEQIKLDADVKGNIIYKTTWGPPLKKED